MVMKKRLHFTDIYRTYARTFEQEDKKRRRSLITWNCLTWSSNVDGKRDRWSLVPWLLDVCGYTYSETNVDLKLPKEEWGPAHKLAIALCRIGLGNNRECECFLPNQIVVLRRRRTGRRSPISPPPSPLEQALQLRCKNLNYYSIECGICSKPVILLQYFPVDGRPANIYTGSWADKMHFPVHFLLYAGACSELQCACSACVMRGNYTRVKRV